MLGFSRTQVRIVLGSVCSLFSLYYISTVVVVEPPLPCETCPLVEPLLPCETCPSLEPPSPCETSPSLEPPPSCEKTSKPRVRSTVSCETLAGNEGCHVGVRYEPSFWETRWSRDISKYNENMAWREPTSWTGCAIMSEDEELVNQWLEQWDMREKAATGHIERAPTNWSSEVLSHHIYYNTGIAEYGLTGFSRGKRLPCRLRKYSRTFLKKFLLDLAILTFPSAQLRTICTIHFQRCV
mmetsp:Transcript_26878/g.58620  ORF Transcript_26878/g.58620 Transcript_26878/m.58620 type:complete len:239 (+) Transcript_26878:217-933(+)